MFRNKNLLSKFALGLTAVLTAVSGSGFLMKPASAAPATAAETYECVEYYTVQRGDYLSRIARMFDTDWHILAEINSLEDPSLIYPGQRLCVDIEPAGTVLPPTGSDLRVEVRTVHIDEYITIHASDFPAYTRLRAYMDIAGDRGLHGIYVGSVVSDADGDFLASFDIPEDLQGEKSLVIRLEDPATGDYAYRNFSNSPVVIPGTGKEPIVLNSNRVPIDERSRHVPLGGRIDLSLGEGGWFLPQSYVDSSLSLARYLPEIATPDPDLEFVQNLVEVKAQYDGHQATYPRGLNYLYFNLDSETRSAYNHGDLHIYHYNLEDEAWETCDVQVLIRTENAPYGRLACILQDFGLYGLAIEN